MHKHDVIDITNAAVLPLTRAMAFEKMNSNSIYYR